MKLKNKTKEKAAACLFILPSLIGAVFLYVLPYIICFIASLYNGSEFAGISNYINLFKNEIFRTAFLNTLVFNVIAIPLLMVISFLLANFINSLKRFSFIIKCALLVPVIAPSASLVSIWNVMFDDFGVINGLLNKIGLPMIEFFNSRFSMVMIILIFIWKYCGFCVVLFSLGISNISSSIIESAKLDGAGYFQIMRKITVPLVVPTGFFVLIMETIYSFKIFREILLLCGRYPNKNIYFLQNYINNNYYNMSFSKLTASSILMSVFIVIVLLAAFLFEKKHSNSE